MKKDWLWDRNLSISQAKQILKNPKHKKFNLLASLLLTRKNDPKEVFKEYIDSLLFCKYWTAIKKRMRKDKWTEPRIVFWQAIYEKLMDRYRKQGISFRKEIPVAKSVICKMVGKQIRDARKELKLSQKELAEKMGISQQLISRIEKGRENVSLITLRNISDALGRKITIGMEK